MTEGRKYGHGSNVILRTMMAGAPHVRGLTLVQKIERASMPVTECGCWIWMQSGNRLGFGTIRVGAKKLTAHRASWIAFRGSIPRGMNVLHSCDVPTCVNPDHLSLGSLKDNAQQRKARARAGKTWLKSSNLTPSPVRRAMSLAERLENLSIPEPNSGCWLWTGAGERYGQILINGRPRPAHRASWEVHRGAIPRGMFVLHRCDVVACINPDHLFLGTQADNVRDCSVKGRRKSVRGSAVNTTKLTLAKVLAIRASSASTKNLAGRYGVDKSTINDIRRRKSWKHI